MATQVQQKYNEWSENYDSCENLTRDLDEAGTKTIFGDEFYEAILEIGCGTGKNTRFFVTIANQVHSMDFSEGMLKKANSSLTATNVKFTQADFNEDWPIESGHYDLASCNLVLEHIENLDHIFREVHRSLRVGGVFYISELHPFRQYIGTQANFESDGNVEKIPAYVHDISEYLHGGRTAGFELLKLDELKHQDDQKVYPRIVTFLFKKSA